MKAAEVVEKLDRWIRLVGRLADDDLRRELEAFRIEALRERAKEDETHPRV